MEGITLREFVIRALTERAERVRHDGGARPGDQ